jgi:hypothetical protein
MDTYSHDGYREDPLATLTPNIRFQRKLGQMQSEAILQIDRDALSRKPEVRNFMLGPTINACLSKLAALSPECSSTLGGWQSPAPSALESADHY